MLTQEEAAALNIKSRVNRQSVLSAVKSAQQRLKLYSRVPPNGFFLFVGTAHNNWGKEKRVAFGFEPPKPINMYLVFRIGYTLMFMDKFIKDLDIRATNRFHTGELSELLTARPTFGFIIMDGSGALFATLSGNSRHIIYIFIVLDIRYGGENGFNQVNSLP